MNDTSQLTAGERDAIITLQTLISASARSQYLLIGAVESHTGQPTNRDNVHIQALGIALADAAELIGALRRLTGEDL